jgi:uncharacterized protein YlxP (DUF503 family)
MVIGALRVELDLPESGSLKDKRQVVKSLLARLMNTFRVSAAEVESLDNPRWGVLGVACVSNSAAHANEVLSKAVNFIEANVAEGHLADYQIEILRAF